MDLDKQDAKPHARRRKSYCSQLNDSVREIDQLLRSTTLAEGKRADLILRKTEVLQSLLKMENGSKAERKRKQKSSSELKQKLKLELERLEPLEREQKQSSQPPSQPSQEPDDELNDELNDELSESLDRRLEKLYASGFLARDDPRDEADETPADNAEGEKVCQNLCQNP